MMENIWPDWKIEKKLGAGSYGSVYSAVREQGTLKQYSAIKHISIPTSEEELRTIYEEGYATDEQSARQYFDKLLENMQFEIQVMYRLRGHKNIVAYEDHRIIPKQDIPGYDLYIRMELLHSLGDVMRARRMTAEEVCRLGIDICSALEVLREEKIVHRDIKPANILRSDAGVYKLGDFGVARQMERTSTIMSKRGTYSYMAPEVYKGETASYASDIYSLGLVLHRLLNRNRPPFVDGKSAQVTFEQSENSVMRRIMGEAIPAPVDADSRLSTIIAAACAYRPQDRYATPKDFRHALQRYLDDSTSPSAFEMENDDEATVVLLQPPVSEPAVNNTPVPAEAHKAEPPQKRTATPSEQAEAQQNDDDRDKKRNAAILICIVVFVVCGLVLLVKNKDMFQASEDMDLESPAPTIVEETVTNEEEQEELIQSGWRTLDGEKYYYMENGERAAGWQVIDGEKYCFTANGILMTGRISVDGVDYILDKETGVVQTGWYPDRDGEVYYLNDDGAIQYGWQTIDGSRYYFHEASGCMATGAVEIDNEYQYFDEDGVFQPDWYKPESGFGKKLLETMKKRSPEKIEFYSDLLSREESLVIYEHGESVYKISDEKSSILQLSVNSVSPQKVSENNYTIESLSSFTVLLNDLLTDQEAPSSMVMIAGCYVGQSEKEAAEKLKASGFSVSGGKNNESITGSLVKNEFIEYIEITCAESKIRSIYYNISFTAEYDEALEKYAEYISDRLGYVAEISLELTIDDVLDIFELSERLGYDDSSISEDGFGFYGTDSKAHPYFKEYYLYEYLGNNLMFKITPKSSLSVEGINTSMQWEQVVNQMESAGYSDVYTSFSEDRDYSLVIGEKIYKNKNVKMSVKINDRGYVESIDIDVVYDLEGDYVSW